METRNNINFTPSQASHPGGIIAMELEERGIKQKDFAKQINMHPVHLNRVIKEKLPITEEIATKLQEALGIKKEMWLRLQEQYEVDKRLLALNKESRQDTISVLHKDLQEIKTLLQLLLKKEEVSLSV